MKLAKAPRTLSLLDRKAYRDAYRGKLLLDAADPVWTEAVSAARLHMGTTYGRYGCVLAQWTYASPDYDRPDYWDGLDKLGLAELDPWLLASKRTVDAHHGFNCGMFVSRTERGHLTELSHLQRAWTYLLRRLGR